MKNWYDGVLDLNIDYLKNNRLALKHLESERHWAAQAFREMPAEDRMFIEDETGDWLLDAGTKIFPGLIYRLREDWERPSLFRELTEKLSEFEDGMTANICPLDLMNFPAERDMMEKAIKLGLCDYWSTNEQWKVWSAGEGLRSFAVRLAPDWRERLKVKGGEG